METLNILMKELKGKKALNMQLKKGKKEEMINKN